MNVVYFLVQLVIVLSNFGLSSQGNSKVKGLYKSTDDVFILNDVNFDKNVVNSESVWIVEFYNSWCGHCVKFSPKWKRFATDLKGWWPVVRVGAVDCAMDDNRDLCRRFDVKGIPTFRLFPIYSDEQFKGISYQSQDSELLEQAVLDVVINCTLYLDPPKIWPKLKPLSEMHEIWDETKDDHHYVAFVYEEPGSYLGTQVILDTLKYKHLLVRRMLKDSVKKFGVHKFPSVFLINRDGTFTEIAKKDHSRLGIVSGLTNLLTSEQLETGNQYLQLVPCNRPENDTDLTDNKQNGDKHNTRPAVYMRDLESTLHYSFRQEIALYRTIDGERLSALRQYINILVKYFPGREEVCGFLQKISEWLNTVDTEISGDQWVYTIDELQTVDNYLPDKIEWVGCAGSEPRYRGYPCGMWTLFHTLTVGAYDYVQKGPKDLKLDVLGAIQNYMKYFFGCETCVKHFLAMASKITLADKSPGGAVLWLWNAHNSANKRLSGDESEDPKHRKIQFPSDKLCTECNSADWDEEKVFDFLVKFYGKNEIVLPSDNTEEEDDGKTVSTALKENKDLDWWELHQRKKDLEKIRTLRQKKVDRLKRRKDNKFVQKSVITYKEGGVDEGLAALQEEISAQRLNGWVFSNVDMSMCIVFYVICTCLILLLYYHFIVRKKYRPFKFL